MLERWNFSQASSKTFLPEEAQILRAKYQSKRFAQMSPDEIHLWAKSLMLKIFVITGWAIPENELQTILLDQFKKKIAESYSTCNPDEVEYALRNYGTDIEDWGKKMNLAFIDKAMSRYFKRRAEISLLEEHKTPSRPGIENRENLSDFGKLRWLAQEIRFIQTGKPVEFVPTDLYDYLDKRGKITATNGEKRIYLEKAIAYRAGLLQKDWERHSNPDSYNALQSFRRMRENRRFSEDEFLTLQDTAKKLLFFDLAMNRK
jgi:hypothetical protein